MDEAGTRYPPTTQMDLSIIPLPQRLLHTHLTWKKTMKRNYVRIFDTTLRDGEQAPGASMTINEKVEIAHHLARLGVDVIEAGFPISSPAQFEAVKRIASEVDGPVICALARAKEADIETAARALAPAKFGRIHTFIGTSDIHIEGKFAHPRYGTTLKEKRETILKMAVEAIQMARQYTSDVEFSPEDAGRTDIGFLCDVVAAAIEAGATTLNIPDTTGYCLPDEYAEKIRTLIARCQPPEHVIFSTHCHDDLGLAVANSLAGVRAGARQVECTINGIGERAGNASLEEIVMALRVRHDVFGLETGINPRFLMTISRLVSTYSGFVVPPNKAIVGQNAFSHEAGIHQDGVLKRRDTYEIMRAEDVGQTPARLRLGRHSGHHGFFARLKQLGFNIPEDQREALYEQFLVMADRKKEIFDEDLIFLASALQNGQASHFYELERFGVEIPPAGNPRASVVLKKIFTGETLEASASGDGPVDALYRAINHAIQDPIDLHSYTIRSVTEGADALGEVTVRIAYGGSFFSGQGTSTDILRASAEAYIQALNHLEAYRVQQQSVTHAIMQAYEGGA